MLISRYLIKTILQAIAVVTVVLAGLELFILLVSELHDIGRGQYGIVAALIYVLLQLPKFSYQFFPLACLLGSLLGLGLLASHSELTVMRSAGVSMRRITGAVLLAALLLLVIVTTFSELFLPSIERYANQHKVSAMQNGQALQTVQGLWLRDNDLFIHIDQVHKDGRLQGVRSFRLNDQQQLVEALYAKSGDYQNKQWWLYNVDISQLAAKQVTSQHYAKYRWHLSISPNLLQVAAHDPSEMSLRYLHQYIKSHKENYAAVNNYALDYWTRILQPLTTCVMMLLAIPFIFGSQRSTTMGARMVWGMMVGFGFYILNQFFGPASLVLQFPPLLAASFPTLIFASSALWMMRRVR